MMGRPHLRDEFGPIMPDRKIGAAVSDRLHANVQRLAHIDGLTEAAWIRRVVEREVMACIVNHPEPIKSAGMFALVHKVERKKGGNE